MTGFQIFLTKIIAFSNSNSTTLSSSSTAILGALSQLSKLASSPNNIIEEFDKVVSGLVKSYNEVVSYLSATIGEELTCCVNYVMSDLDSSLRQYIDEFRQEDENGFEKAVFF